MINLTKNIVIIKGKIKTFQIDSIELQNDKYIIKFSNSDKEYSFSSDNVIWLKNPVEISVDKVHVFARGARERNIKSINLFTDCKAKYYAIEYGTGFIKQYSENEVEIKTSCITAQTTTIFDYIKKCAGINTLGVKENEDTEGILSSIYSRIDFIDDSTAAATYLNPTKGIKHPEFGTPIFPFGCNASQEKAVRTALTRQISVIQGPPGTGKTQTILNIIANLLIAKKSVMIVSNNNSATANILEKLDKNGFGFLVAPLGKKENKEAFIANQPKLNPELPSWSKSDSELSTAFSNVKSDLQSVIEVFKMQERLAAARQELSEVEIEKIHFEQENSIFAQTSVIPQSEKLLRLLKRLTNFAIKLNDCNSGVWNRISNSLQQLELEFRLRMMLNLKATLSVESVSHILTFIEFKFYISRISELKNEIAYLETTLSRHDAKELMKSLTQNSMLILKATLSKHFSRERSIIESTSDLYHNGEKVLNDFPVVLSTTFSSRLCFNSDTLFDYVIMDEASQVGIDTGLLALSCAKNAVIVGDTMQLPNVIQDEDKLKLKEIGKTVSVPDSYNVAINSLLSSVLSAIPAVPTTMLKEHYRCHPDIINFCNQKFYGGELIIMTQRRPDDKPLIAITTSEGHHSRGHFNQREIDTIKLELLPELEDHSDIGVVTPYNEQVDAIRSQLHGIEVDTIHKYQGREKDTIIMSVTDDVITDFSDNANLLNVAVSRAKNKFCLVVTGNPQELKGNIHDLLGYIRYHRGTIIESKLRSVYDYLGTQTSSNISTASTDPTFDPEEITLKLIEKIRTTVPHLSHIKVLRHYPLRRLIKDTDSLSNREIRYAMHPSTHIDFFIINRVSKEPLLAIETDGYTYHNKKSEQYDRDRMKDHILKSYGLPLLRLSTVGHSEEQQIVDALTHLST